MTQISSFTLRQNHKNLPFRSPKDLSKDVSRLLPEQSTSDTGAFILNPDPNWRSGGDGSLAGLQTKRWCATVLMPSSHMSYGRTQTKKSSILTNILETIGILARTVDDRTSVILFGSRARFYLLVSCHMF